MIFDARVVVCGAFIAGRSVMVVGDGDFSFSVQVVSSARQSLAPRWYCTSVFSQREEVVKRHVANNSPIMDNLAWFQASGVEHHFGVDATQLSQTAPWSQTQPCDTIVWNYPFPESNDVDVAVKQALVAAFFASAGEWRSFAREAGGIVVLGLKSRSRTQRHCTDEEDFQFKHWAVESAASAHGFRLTFAVGPMVPFWRPRHVSGRPLCKSKEIDGGKVTIKYYAFRHSTSASAG